MFNLVTLEKTDVFIDIPESDLKGIVFHVIRHCKLPRKDDIFNAVIAREELKSTAIGNNTAIPHCRLKDLDRFYVKFVLFRNKPGYYAPNGEGIRYIFLVAGPNDDSQGYLSTLAHIAKLMKDENLRKALRQAKDAKEVCRLFRKYTQSELEEVHIWK